MSYEQQIFDPEFLELQFFDSTGAVNLIGWGTSLFFSNQEILSIEIFEKFRPDAAKTALGLGYASAIEEPKKWKFSVRTWKQETHDKIRQLHKAVENGWRIFAEVKGFYLYDPGIGRFFNPGAGGRNITAILQYGDSSYQSVERAKGMLRNDSKAFELWESLELTLPSQTEPVIIKTGGDVSIVMNNQIIQTGTIDTGTT